MAMSAMRSFSDSKMHGFPCFAIIYHPGTIIAKLQGHRNMKSVFRCDPRRHGAGYTHRASEALPKAGRPARHTPPRRIRGKRNRAFALGGRMYKGPRVSGPGARRASRFKSKGMSRTAHPFVPRFYSGAIYISIRLYAMWPMPIFSPCSRAEIQLVSGETSAKWSR